MTDFDTYSNYLKTRSRLGLIYRHFWLYPRLSRQLKGQVLDIGCGIGDFLAFRPNTQGVDINPQLVAFCRGRGLNACEMAIDTLPFDDASFDGVVLDNVLEHILEPGPILAEVGRVLRPAGIFLIGVPGETGFRADSDHKVYYDEARLAATLTNAGFYLRRLIHMPIKSSVLKRKIPQYCIYGVFEK